MKKTSKKLLSLVMYITGVIVALAVGFALTSETLIIPLIPAMITIIAGWVVVIATILGVILAIANQ